MSPKLKQTNDHSNLRRKSVLNALETEEPDVSMAYEQSEEQKVQ